MVAKTGRMQEERDDHGTDQARRGPRPLIGPVPRVSEACHLLPRSGLGRRIAIRLAARRVDAVFSRAVFSRNDHRIPGLLAGASRG